MRDRSGHATGSPPKFTPLRFVNFGGDPKNSFFLRKLCKVILTKSQDEIEFYLNHPQLRAYKINDKEQVEKVKKMIKYLKKVQWTSTLNRIIE